LMADGEEVAGEAHPPQTNSTASMINQLPLPPSATSTAISVAVTLPVGKDTEVLSPTSPASPQGEESTSAERRVVLVSSSSDDDQGKELISPEGPQSPEDEDLRMAPLTIPATKNVAEEANDPIDIVNKLRELKEKGINLKDILNKVIFVDMTP